MNNTLGQNVSITLFGESHGEAIGAVLDGIPSGIKIDRDFIAKKLSLRRPFGDISTKRQEKDDFKIISGLNGDITAGTPICIIIENKDVNPDDYENDIKPRPSHADYTAYKKHGVEGVLSGGGHFSGRLTAPIVAAGAVAMQILEKKGIKIGSHIKSILDVEDRDFADFYSDISALQDKTFAVLDNEAAKEMQKTIEKAALENDSVGGIIETAIIGVDAGLGEPFFDTLEGALAKGLFAIPAVKGVEFGAGFSITKMFGSVANDQMEIKDGKIRTLTNNSGGINGGISNGEPIVIRIAVKPTPSVKKEQKTVDLQSKTQTTLIVLGRHDPSIVHRARVVADSIAALTILDMLSRNEGSKGLRI